MSQFSSLSALEPRLELSTRYGASPLNRSLGRGRLHWGSGEEEEESLAGEETAQSLRTARCWTARCWTTEGWSSHPPRRARFAASWCVLLADSCVFAKAITPTKLSCSTNPQPALPVDGPFLSSGWPGPSGVPGAKV